MAENKKTLLFSVLGVILLLVVVIGVSYAMYTFSAQGSKVNQITTGTISVSYEEASQVTLTNAYPSTDATGSAVTGHDLVFTVTGAITGSTSVKYDLALANITPGATLTAEYIKFNLKKGDTYLIGTANTGVTVASRATNKGTLITTGYLLDTDTLTSTKTGSTYTLRAWVADTYKLPQGANTTSEDGKTQTNASTAETFKFGVEIKATA